MKLLQIIGCLIPAATLPAAELVTRDLIAEVSVLPTAYDYTLDAGNNRLTGQDAFTSALGASIGGRLSVTRPGDHVGLIIGLDLTARQLSSGGDSSLDVFAPRAAAGVGWAISDRWELYGEALAGWGIARLDIAASNAAPQISATGTATLLSGRLVGSYRITRDLALTAHAGWDTMDVSASGSNVDIGMKFADPVVGLGLSWRISARPVRLE